MVTTEKLNTFLAAAWPVALVEVARAKGTVKPEFK